MKYFEITVKLSDGIRRNMGPPIEATSMRQCVIMFWQMWFNSEQPTLVEFKEVEKP